MEKNKIKYYLIEFFVKVGIMCIVTFILGVIDVVVECVFMKDISLFMHFTIGYLSCLILNWRWFFNANRQEEK